LERLPKEGMLAYLRNLEIRAYQTGDERAIIGLWRRCGGIRPKLEIAPDMFLVGVLDSEVIASVMAGYEGHRGWLNYVAVAPPFRGRGYGRQILAHAEELLRQRGCPKINLQVRPDNASAIHFYQRLGFAVDDVASMGKRLVTDEPGHREPGQR
jgi:ribosomal protein S18 acetylase RimI-like enzyme